jgi:hypothetical protein
VLKIVFSARKTAIAGDFITLAIQQRALAGARSDVVKEVAQLGRYVVNVGGLVEHCGSFHRSIRVASTAIDQVHQRRSKSIQAKVPRVGGGVSMTELEGSGFRKISHHSQRCHKRR